MVARPEFWYFWGYHIEYWPPLHFVYAVFGFILYHIGWQFKGTSKMIPSSLSAERYGQLADACTAGLIGLTFFTPPMDAQRISSPYAVEIVELFVHRPLQIVLCTGSVYALLHTNKGVVNFLLEVNLIQEFGERALLFYLFHRPFYVGLHKLNSQHRLIDDVVWKFWGYICLCILVVFNLSYLQIKMATILAQQWRRKKAAKSVSLQLV